MRLGTRLTHLGIVTCLALPLAGCGGDDDSGDGVDEQPAVDPAGTNHTYVISEILLPDTPAEAREFGIDLDLDDRAVPDNQLGLILPGLAGLGQVDLQSALSEQVQDGGIQLLANIKATDLTQASGAGAWIYLGENPTPAPCTDPDDPTTCGQHLEGNATFDIASSSPTDAFVSGNIIGGQFTGGPGNITVQIALVEGSAPLTLNLIAARMQIGMVSDDGLISGKLAGGILESELKTVILPGLVDIMASIFEEDCPSTTPPCCTESSVGASLMGQFDKDNSCTVTVEEVENSSLISAFLMPDVDLLDDDGNYSPTAGDEAVPDALSVGLGFTAVPAEFTVP